MTNNMLFSIFKQRAYVYIRNAGWLYRFSCIVLAGPPADCPFFHVGFYPDRRLTVHCYKKFISGPPADGSQRVRNLLGFLAVPQIVRLLSYAKSAAYVRNCMCQLYYSLLQQYSPEFTLLACQVRSQRIKFQMCLANGKFITSHQQPSFTTRPQQDLQRQLKFCIYQNSIWHELFWIF